MNINDFGMPLTSVGGDRKYGSADWQEYYRMLAENGIIGNITNELQIKPQAIPNKTVYVDEGAIIINGVTRIVDSTIDLSLSENTSGLTRIDRIVARLNLNEDIRKLEFAVVEGTPDAGAPGITRNETVYEMSLAQIELTNGYSTITANEITDERLDEILCGYFRYRAKPAWYPGDAAPSDAWMYTMFKNLLTTQEIIDIEANPSLMNMINSSPLKTAVDENTLALTSRAKIATGNYIGTGVYGSDNKNTLLFPFEPKFVVIKDKISTYHSNIMFFVNPNTRTQVKPSTSSPNSYQIHITWDGNTMLWYSADHDSYQFNSSGATYHYVAIG